MCVVVSATVVLCLMFGPKMYLVSVRNSYKYSNSNIISPNTYLVSIRNSNRIGKREKLSKSYIIIPNSNLVSIKSSNSNSNT